MNQRKTKTEEEGTDTGSWALSYGDMMTLLLTFFVLIVSFSTTELIKFRQAMGSLQKPSGLLHQDGTSIIKLETQMNPISDKQVVLQNLLKQMAESVLEMELEEEIEIELEAGGVNFRISDALLFNLGKADLRAAVPSLLKDIGMVIQLFSCDVKVEGHTDNLPIHTGQFPSNWELSFARAKSVLSYFIDEIHVDPTRIAAVGCGEFRPLLPNDSEENRSRNRRVEVFLNWGSSSETLEL